MWPEEGEPDNYGEVAAAFRIVCYLNAMCNRIQVLTLLIHEYVKDGQTKVYTDTWRCTTLLHDTLVLDVLGKNINSKSYTGTVSVTINMISGAYSRYY